MKALLEIFAWVLGIALLLTVGKGLAPVSGGFVRALMSPVVLVLVFAFVFLLRWRRTSSRRKSS